MLLLIKFARIPRDTCEINKSICVHFRIWPGTITSDGMRYKMRLKQKNQKKRNFLVEIFVWSKLLLLLFKKTEESSEGVACAFVLFSSQETCLSLSPIGYQKTGRIAD